MAEEGGMMSHSLVLVPTCLLPDFLAGFGQGWERLSFTVKGHWLCAGATDYWIVLVYLSQR